MLWTAGQVALEDPDSKDWTAFDAARASVRAGKRDYKASWKPEMTPAEGHAWAKAAGTKYDKTVVHLTSTKVVDAIEGTGFHTNWNDDSIAHEAGAYFATDRPSAEFYSYKGDAVLSAVVVTHNPLTLDLTATLGPHYDGFRQQALDAAYPDRAKMIEVADKLGYNAARMEMDAKATTMMLKAAGYDAVIIRSPSVESDPGKAVGGNQIVVFDQKQVVVIGSSQITSAAATATIEAAFAKELAAQEASEAATESVMSEKDWTEFDAARESGKRNDLASHLATWAEGYGGQGGLEESPHPFTPDDYRKALATGKGKALTGAQMLLNAVNKAPALDKPLYRGIGLEDHGWAERQFPAGKTVDMNLSSWSEKRTMALYLAKDSDGYEHVLLKLEPGSHSVPFGKVGMTGHEWLGAGRYEVISNRVVMRAARPDHVVITLRQVGAFKPKGSGAWFRKDWTEFDAARHAAGRTASGLRSRAKPGSRGHPEVNFIDPATGKAMTGTKYGDMMEFYARDHIMPDLQAEFGKGINHLAGTERTWPIDFQFDKKSLIEVKAVLLTRASQVATGIGKPARLLKEAYAEQQASDWGKKMRQLTCGVIVLAHDPNGRVDTYFYNGYRAARMRNARGAINPTWRHLGTYTMTAGDYTKYAKMAAGRVEARQRKR